MDGNEPKSGQHTAAPSAGDATGPTPAAWLVVDRDGDVKWTDSGPEARAVEDVARLNESQHPATRARAPFALVPLYRADHMSGVQLPCAVASLPSDAGTPEPDLTDSLRTAGRKARAFLDLAAVPSLEEPSATTTEPLPPCLHCWHQYGPAGGGISSDGSQRFHGTNRCCMCGEVQKYDYTVTATPPRAHGPYYWEIERCPK